MTQYLGDFQYGATVYIPFASYSGVGASITMTGLAVTDIEIYKNGSVTQRASDAGYTLLDTDGIDFDGVTGIHGFSIDTSDNTTAGFWGPGNDYFVVVASVTIDSQTVNFVYSFSIENRHESNVLLRTTIATLASQTSFTLTAGSADDNAYNGCTIVISDVASVVQKAVGVINDYTGSTKTVTLQTDPAIFTMATTDYVTILADRSLKSTVDNRPLDVSSGGEAGLDWANIGSPTTAQNLSATNIDVDQVVASVSGAVGSVTGAVGSVAAGGITASSIAADAIGASELAADAVAEIADAVWDEAASGHVASGSFGQAMNIVRANTAQAGAATTITLDASASAVDDFYTNDIIFITGGTGAGQARIISDYVGATKVATVSAWVTNPSSDSIFVILPFGAIPGASAPTAAEVADAVWDEDATAHQTQGSFGQAIGDPGADSDTIWALANTNLNATVSSRASQTSLDTLDDFVDTEVAAIKTVTDILQNMVLQRTTIATLSSQTSFTLTAGSADNDAYNGCVIVIEDAATAVQKAVGVILDYTGATKTVTLLNDPAVFTMATTDIVTIIADRALKPAVDNRTLGVAADGDLLEVNTLTGHTAQTGDAFARLGAPAGASVSADILVIDNFVDDIESRLGTPSNLGGGATIAANLSDIEAQTDDIGTAGAGLTAVPWNASWDAEVQSKVDDALVAQNLDHLVKIAVDTNFATTVHLDSVIGQLADNGTTATFDRTTDSLEALQAEHDATQTAVDNVDNFIDTEIADIQARLPAALVSGRMDASVGAMAANVMTAAAAAADLTTELQSGLATAAALDTVDNFLDTEIADIQARLPAALTAGGNIKADGLAINGSTAAAVRLALSAATIVSGAAIAGTLSTTQMTTDLTNAVNDHYNGRIIIWTSGTLLNQATDITDYDGTTKTLTFTAITSAPSAGDAFIIV